MNRHTGCVPVLCTHPSSFSLFLQMFFFTSLGRPSRAMLFAFAVSLMTLAKTVLFFLVDICSEFSNSGHVTNARDYALLYLLPNSVWVFIPGCLVIALGRELLHLLDPPQQTSKQKQKAN